MTLLIAVNIPFQKNLLVHTQTALEAAFLTEKDSGIKCFVPSQQLSPSDSGAFKAQLLNLWEGMTSIPVKK